MNYGEICVLLLAVMPAVLAVTDYCQANLCDRGKKHIACNNKGDFASICVGPEIINITKKYRRQIVGKHNELRNKIAKGFEHLPPAKRMATMLWDNELAKFAELNVKQCEMRNDQCRNTPRFTFVGQNIASATWKDMILNVDEIINDQIEAWFDEYKNCTLDVIKSYNHLKGLPYSHFTVMVQDKSNRIGCAILRSHNLPFLQQIMVCNYAYGNKLGAPVYSVGPPASKCTTGTNSRFQFLCSLRKKSN